MRKEHEAEELKKKFHLSQDGIAKALASDYVCSFFINKESGQYIEYSASDVYRSLGLPAVGDDFFSFSENALLKSVLPEDRDLLLTAFTKENIFRVLEVDKSFFLTFRVLIHDQPTYVEMKITDMVDDPDHIVAGIRNVDAHMRRIVEYESKKKENLTFAGLAEALASDYACLVYVDTKNDQYTEYYSTERFKKMGIPPFGDLFFSGINGLGANVYPDDKPIFDAACNKENVLRVLNIDRSFFLTVRLVVENEPVYCRIKITRMMLEDEFHVVVGITNIDEQMKREQGYARSFDEIKEVAYRDALTGVKNKHAYGDSESRINAEIEAGIKRPFALLVCDVNGLKKVNDTLGHKAGDTYIKDACMMICQAFKHSPVFRVGGDEFVVLLEDYDFEFRHESLSQINRLVEENIKTGKPSISIGMAEFCKETDHELHDLFARADEAMYARKKALKAERVD